MKPFISIIIPAYNCEKSIQETLQSILSQSVQDYELLLVNDGSTDNTEKILKKFESQDRRVKVKTIKNAGPANARNVGMSMARGEYLMFVDSDDTLQPDALSTVEEILHQHPVDLIIFGFYIKNTLENQVFEYSVPPCDLTKKLEIASAFSSLYFNNLLNQIWNKVYRTELIQVHNIVFPDYQYGEDRLFVLEFLEKCQSVRVLEECFYNYFMRSTQSLVTKFYDKKAVVCELIDQKVKNLIACFGITDEKDLKRFRYMYIKSMVSCETNLFLPSCPYSPKKKNEALRELLSSPYLQKELSQYRRYHVITDVAAIVMKTQWTWLNRSMAKFILYMSRWHSNAFIKSKHPDAKNVSAS